MTWVNLSKSKIILSAKKLFFIWIFKTWLSFRIQAIMGHAQTVYNFPTLDAGMKLEVDEIEHYDGDLEADTTNLKWV